MQRPRPGPRACGEGGLGGRDLNPDYQDQNLASYQLDDPPTWALRRIGIPRAPLPCRAMAPQLTALIMAAGQGTRMRSVLPKVLHPVCGVPMVHWVIAAARAAGADRVVCVTRPGDGVAEALPEGVESVAQTEGEGTGSAVLAARDALDQSPTVVVLSGDVPLTSATLI